VGGIRFVNLHLVPNFETHPWKGRLLGWLGEKDVPRIQKQQLAAIGEEVTREGGREGRWCAVGDFNVHGPEVLGVGSRVTEVRKEGEREGGEVGEGAESEYAYGNERAMNSTIIIPDLTTLFSSLPPPSPPTGHLPQGTTHSGPFRDGHALHLQDIFRQ